VTEEGWRTGDEGDWTVELTCGHRIEVPAVPGALATIACVREHRRLHHRIEPDSEVPSGLLFPTTLAVGLVEP